MTEAEEAAVRFNAMINAGDVDGLARRMSDDHRFVDTAGHVVSGKASCLEVWGGFFAAFPSYRNVFGTIGERDGLVVATGHSVCDEHPDLAGPALWTARVGGGLVTEWRVYDDTPETREALGVAP